MRPPITAPRRKAASAALDRAKESPGDPAAAKPRKTTFPVLFAVNTRPRPNTLAASTSPVTTVSPSRTGTSARSRSEDIADPAPDVRHVLGGSRIAKERAGDEVLPVRDDRHMTADLNRHHHRGLAADKA